MNYELAKQLKDAGYPIKTRVLGFDFVSKQGMIVAGNISHRFHEDIDFILPTLSELIESCGDDFVSLDKLEDGWEACGKYWCCEAHGEGRKFEEGSNPEVAVARLWLALHPKK